ncbi:MAG TPA: NADH-quinone oxidoreductase subunit C [Vicinamibacterales bacterium]|nr:NADH-quinone oxidoreductase subunit C [Vicinamibacterales bacterium]
MQAAAIIEILARGLAVEASSYEAVESPDRIPTLYVPRETLVESCRLLRDTPELRFAVLVDLVPVDYHPRVPRYELSYLLVCPGSGGFGTTPRRARLKVRVQAGETVPSVAGVWTAANWAEREAFDFFGISFDGHPDPRRILMPDDWEGYPMRKDYPVQIKQPVKTYAPLQVSEEQFVANIEAARGQARTD